MSERIEPDLLDYYAEFLVGTQKCYCRHCQSEGFHDMDESCLFWKK